MTEQPFSGPFVITGLSGSGKTVLSRSLEDLGYTVRRQHSARAGAGAVRDVEDRTSTRWSWWLTSEPGG